MKKQSRYNMLFGLNCIACIVLGIFIAMAYPDASDYIKSKMASPSFNETDDCKDLDLFHTAYCLRDRLLPIYSYNLSNVGKSLTNEELIEMGGVCSHYAKWYEERAKDLGFYTRKPIIEIDEKTAHVFTIMSNDEGYCILDQMSVSCIKMDKEVLDEDK